MYTNTNSDTLVADAVATETAAAEAPAGGATASKHLTIHRTVDRN